MRRQKILCIHGLGRSASDWDGVREGLEEFGVVVTPQLPRTSVRKLVESAPLLEIGDAVLVGHSVGAVVALRIAASTEVRGLILTSSFVPPARNGRSFRAALLDYGSHRLAIARTMSAQGFRPRSGNLEALVSLARLGLQPGVFHQAAARVEAPVLVIHGQQDHYVPIDFALAATTRHPAWTLRVIAGAGHNLHVDQPDEWVEVASAWLRALPR